MRVTARADTTQLVGILTRSITSCQIDISSSKSRRCVLKQSPVFSSPVLGLRMKENFCSLGNQTNTNTFCTYTNTYSHTHTHAHTYSRTQRKYRGRELLAYPSFTVITINWRINQLQGRDGLVHIDQLEECRFRGESALYL